eukprot:CAMPEP_0194282172 /NCGR_PEP_ID=MMETSP0169-20130528/22545_1 /TAXON_ID=218684 /ORGANISM="Corethron pennatum, Strain L29A3" /LENGTH=538 /DNA_ID=CAMNT_0039027421 /DNA_START=331 /DNA_END=1943 /DNA_ORIENTATION=-
MYTGITGGSLEESHCGSYGRSLDKKKSGSNFELPGQERQHHSLFPCSSLDEVAGGTQQLHIDKIGVNEAIQQQLKLLNNNGFCTLQRNKVGAEDYREHAYISKEAFKKPCLTQLPPFEPQLKNAVGNSPFCFPVSSFKAQAQPAAFSAEELTQASFPVSSYADQSSSSVEEVKQEAQAQQAVFSIEELMKASFLVSSYMDQFSSSTEEVKRERSRNISFTLPTQQRRLSAEELIRINLLLCNNNNTENIGNMDSSELRGKNIIQEGESLRKDSAVTFCENIEYYESDSPLVSSLGNKDNTANESFSDMQFKFPEEICSTGKKKSSLSKCTPRKSKHTLYRTVIRPGCNKQNKTQEKYTVRDKKRCSNSGCLKSVQTGGKCVAHGGGKRCSEADCNKYALSGGKCYAHGVRKICTFTYCTKSAKPGGKCFIHGGGKRCTKEGCVKHAKIGGKCVNHGGGRRCLEIGCAKSAQAGGRCVFHGGGKRCSEVGCPKSAKKGGKCIAHGGGRRCSEAGCTKSVQVGGKCIAHGDNIDTSVCTV